MDVSKEYKKNVLNPKTDIHYAISHNLDKTKFPHQHDFFELSLIVDGEIEVEFSNKNILLKKGALLLIRSDEVHGKKFLKNGVQANLAFSSKTFKELLTFLGPGFNSDIFLDTSITPMVMLSTFQQEELIDRLNKLYLLPIENFEIIKTNLKILLFDILTKYFFVRKKEKDNIPFWLTRTIKEINKKEHFTEGVNALINISGKSHEHICRCIKKHLNTTPTNIVNSIRLNYAANLLINTDLKIIDICYDSGFNSLSYFHNEFKKKYNMSPGEYRIRI
ncbi:MAG: helix-turn-helix domain-containing protein [Lachnospirales bacterium]